MKEPEIIIEKGREKDELSSLSYEFFNAVSKYNKEHSDQAHVIVLACDSKGGASFMIGNTKTCVKEFIASAARNKSFLDLLRGILDNFTKEIWLARDKDGGLIMYENKPFKDKRAEQWTLGGQWVFLPDDWFPEVQWSDKEPTKVKLIIDK